MLLGQFTQCIFSYCLFSIEIFDNKKDFVNGLNPGVIS